MKIGIVHRNGRLAIADHEVGATVYNFSIGAPGRSGLAMLHAAAATPARYLTEMARRLSQFRQGGVMLLFNPMLELDVAEVSVALRSLFSRAIGNECVVAHDADGVPVAYLLPPSDAKVIVGLSFLSAVDAETDRELLGHLRRGAAHAMELKLRDRGSRTGNGFYADPDRLKIYSWLAKRACHEFESRGASRDGVPVAAILPFHAGDVLFMCMAIRRGVGYCQAIVVDRRYRPIVDAVAPELICIELDFSGGRSTVVDWDRALIDHIATDLLPRGYLYLYCRPSRAYDDFSIHLVDQYAFATGDPRQSESLVRAHNRLRVERQRVRKKVLLYVDGGWPLKVYPEAMQRALIGQLHDAGLEVTVMSPSVQSTVHGCPNVQFSGVVQLHELLIDFDLVIGMDSFPTHYAIHVLGIPTICLFSSTAPGNSDAGSAPHYRALEMGLPCRPCRAVARCPKYDGDVCRNFSAPDKVFAAVIDLMSSSTG